MPYEIETNRAGSARLRQETSLMTSGRAHGREAAASHYKFYELEPALVISIDLENKDSREIGKAVLRPIYSYATVPESKLPVAVPLDANVKNFPIKGEIVIVVEYGGRMYYTQRLNFLNFANQNITQDTYKYLSQGEKNADDRSATAAGNPNVNESEEEDKPGKYFTPDKTIQSVLPMEGDIIYEGRFGNSIRFGGSVEEGTSGVDEKLKRFKGTWAIGEKVGAPIIIIRNGQPEGGDSLKPLVEDINKDPSSIYLTNGQIVPLKVANTNQKAWKDSAPNKYDGNQVIIASDRIILNARGVEEGEIMMFATAPIGLSTAKSLYFDVGVDTIINSPKIYLGLDAKEHVVLGDKAVEWLKSLIGEIKNLINAINETVVRTGTGPSDPVKAWAPNAPNYNKVNTALTQLENKIDTLLSKQNFTL